MPPDKEPVPVAAALTVSRILWPDFIEEHGCVFLAWHVGTNAPPANDTDTGWESFVNHTHMFDEFTNNAKTITNVHEGQLLNYEEAAYDEHHPDFIAACELGQQIAKLWALKLKLDFPSARFRVYYTQYDNPIVRFHKVRDDEPEWLSDEALQTATDPSFRNTLVYDTCRINFPSSKYSNMVH
jgi:hypothetical protein